MNIVGKITGLKYKILLPDELKEVDVENFDIDETEIANFIEENKISASQKTLIETVFAEAKQNNFSVKIQFSR